MKYFKNFKIALLVAILIPIFSNAQIRPNINSFSSADRTTLATLMQQYITLEVVQMHCDYTSQGGPNIHDDFNFLPFHRMYLQGMEDYLVEQGYPQFVPLPKWTQDSCLPLELQVIDPICSSLTGPPNGNCRSSGISCGTPNWCPTNSLPSNLNKALQGGLNDDLCDWPFSPVSPGGSNSNGLSNQIESPYHNNGHGLMGGAMGQFVSPVLPAFWLWHANIDDVWKTWEEYCTNQSSNITNAVDLWMQDTHDNLLEERDSGVEPNIDNGPMWRSEDIWIRNQPDGFTDHTHQNPEHQNFSQSFVYVRIRNRGFQTSTGTEQLQLHWAKANTSLAFPAYWDSTTFVGTTVMGNIIGTQTINAVAAGDQIILEFPWSVPDTADYSFNANPQHFCLLARILNEPMTFPEGTNVNTNTKNNNNIVWKNITVVDQFPLGIVSNDDCPDDLMESIGVSVSVSNEFNHPETFDVVFKIPESEIQKELTGTFMLHSFMGENLGTVDASTLTRPIPETPITEEGTVILEMSNELYDKWVKGGKKGSGFIELKSPSMSPQGQSNNQINEKSNLFIGDGDGKRFEVTGVETTFENITLDANEITFAAMMVVYPDNPISDDDEFVYTVQQLMATTQVLVGGVDFHINKPDCSTHSADAGVDETIDKNCNTKLEYVPTQVCDNYYWLNGNGNVIATNTDAFISPSSTTTYTLKMVSEQGCISSDEVTVNTTNQICFKEHEIIKVTPNPAKDRAVVKYKLGNVSNAELRLVNVNNGIDRIYSLDVNNTSITLDLSTCTLGVYGLVLICDGVNQDSKNIMIK